MAATFSEENKENRANQPYGNSKTLTIKRDGRGFGFTISATTSTVDKNEDAIVLNPDGGATDPRSGLMTSQPTRHSQDTLDNFYVTQVSDGGAAYRAGMRPGDNVVTVNGQAVSGKTFSQMIALIRSGDQSLKLLVVPKEDEGNPMGAYNPAYFGSHHDSSHSARNKPPQAPRYKSELRVVPEDGRIGNSASGVSDANAEGARLSPVVQPYDPRLAPHHASVTSLGSASSSGSHVSSRDSASRQGDLGSSLTLQGHGSLALGQGQPPPQQQQRGYLSQGRAAYRQGQPPQGITHTTAYSSSPNHQTSHFSSPHQSQRYPQQSRGGVEFGTNRQGYPRNESAGNRAEHNNRNVPPPKSSANVYMGDNTGSRQSPVGNVPPNSRTSSRNITLRYGSENRTGSLDSISRSSDSSAENNNNVARSRVNTMPPQQPNYAQAPSTQQHSAIRPYTQPQQSNAHATKRSLDNLDTVTNQTTLNTQQSMGNNLKKQRSRSGDRYIDPATGNVQDPRKRGNRATEELRRKFFENGLTPQGPGPVYGATSLSTSALHTAPNQQQQRQRQPAQKLMTSSQHGLPMTSFNSQPDVTASSVRTHRNRSPQVGDNERYGANRINTLHQSIEIPQGGAGIRGEGNQPSSNENYGFTVSLSGLGARTNNPQSLTDAVAFDHSTPVSQSHPHLNYHQSQQQRHSLQEQNVVNLVTARKKMFESDSNLEESSHVIGGEQGKMDQSGRSIQSMTSPESASSQYRYGSNSVSSKTAFYEHIERSNERLADSASNLPVTGGSANDLNKNDALKPLLNSKVTIPFYFRGIDTPTSGRKVAGSFSPDRRGSHESQGQGYGTPTRRSRSHSSDNERSPPDYSYERSPSPELHAFYRQRITRRQPSYLNAIEYTMSRPRVLNPSHDIAVRPFKRMQSQPAKLHPSQAFVSSQLSGDVTKAPHLQRHHSTVTSQDRNSPHRVRAHTLAAASDTRLLYSAPFKITHHYPKKIIEYPPETSSSSKNKMAESANVKVTDDVIEISRQQNPNTSPQQYGRFHSDIVGGIPVDIADDGFGNNVEPTSVFAASWHGTHENPYATHASVSRSFDPGTRSDGNLDNQDGNCMGKTGYDGVRLRTNLSPNEEDKDNKLTRRTSYLMATRQAVPSNAPQQPEDASAPPDKRIERARMHLALSLPPLPASLRPTLLSPPPVTYGGPSSPSPSSSSATLTPSTPRESPPKEASAAANEKQGGVTCEESGAGLSGASSNQLETPQQRPKNIKKLKAFFGERTPKIMEASQHSKMMTSSMTTSQTSMTSQEQPPASPLGELVIEGVLNCKLDMTDGKRSTDRSWRPMWAVLRGHVLCLYRDKASSANMFSDEHPISVKSALVDIANNYTKKRHVFRLKTFNGSEYLFQCDTHEDMLRWIQAMRDNNNPDQDVGHGDVIMTSSKMAASDGGHNNNKSRDGLLHSEAGVSSQDLISRKISRVQNEAPSQGHQIPIQGQAKKSKGQAKSMRAKSPAVHSPAPKQKKQASRDEHLESPRLKEKEYKTWKGKMAKKFKRTGSSSANPVMSENSDVLGENASFGVHLEDCPPSNETPTVPFVVEVCTKFVEAHGLENQGIYRVPGNTGAVNMLQHELDKGPDNVDFDNEKWLDVNVVSSLLKSFFRKLPEPLIPEDLYDILIAANRTENPEKRMLKIKKILHDLPEHHFDTFKVLADHLYKVQQNQGSNKMDVRNIAIVFGPTIVRTTDDSMLTMVKDMSDQCRIIESVVSYPQWFFGSWETDVNVPHDRQTHVEAPPISGMNQQLINKAENMQLGERGRDFSAKELVSSVFSAANKKIRRREKHKGESIDVDFESETSYQERNIDAEVENRIGRVATEFSSMVAGTTTGHVATSKQDMTSSSSSKIMTSSESKSMSKSSSGPQLDSLTETQGGLSVKNDTYNKTSTSTLSSLGTVTSQNSSSYADVQNARTDQSKVSPQHQSSSSISSYISQGSGVSRGQDIYRAKVAFIQGSDNRPNPADTRKFPPSSARQFPEDSNRGQFSSPNRYIKEDTRQFPANAQKLPNETEPPSFEAKPYNSQQTQKASVPLHQSQNMKPSQHGTPVRSQNDATTPPSSMSRDPRLDEDANAMRERVQREQRENRQRAYARHKIEVELRKTSTELEQEDDDFMLKSTDPASYRYTDYLRGKMAMGDNTSLVSADHFNTSDYSTDPSNYNTLESRVSNREERGSNREGMGPRTGSHPRMGSGNGNFASPGSLRSNLMMMASPGSSSGVSSGKNFTPTSSQQNSRQNSQVFGANTAAAQDGGKYFVMSSTNVRPPMMTPRKQPNNPPGRTRDDMALNRSTSSRRKTQEISPPTNTSPPFDVTKVVGNSTLQRREKERTNTRHSRRRRDSSGNRHRCDSQRFGGSLDSLLDTSGRGIDPHRDSSSYYDTDSEQGELFQALVGDFDRRLNDLKDDLEPPPPLPPPPRQRSKTLDSPRDNKINKPRIGPPKEIVNAPVISSSGGPGNEKASRPDSVLLTVGGERHLVPRQLVDKFRDPSLHRVTTPEGSDPQIGIACRFERNSSGSEVENESVTAAALARSIQLRDAKNSNLFASNSASVPLRSQPAQQQQVQQEKYSSSPNHQYYANSANLPFVPNLATTERSSNTDNRKEVTFQDRSDNLSGTNSYNKPGSTPHSKVYRDSISAQHGNDRSASSGSPVALRKRDKAAVARRKREHRRHTVAGTDDVVHLRALREAAGEANKTNTESPSRTGQTHQQQQSAWERLRPQPPMTSSTKHVRSSRDVTSRSSPPRDVITWCHQERLRQARSTSDLLALNDADDFIGINYDVITGRGGGYREDESGNVVTRAYYSKGYLNKNEAMCYSSDGNNSGKLVDKSGSQRHNFDFYPHERTFSPSEQRQYRRRMRSRDDLNSPTSPPPKPEMMGMTSSLVTTSPMTSQSDLNRRSGAFTFESSI